eukprot:1159205-Pelagomonas_calceolata.AAC.5
MDTTLAKVPIKLPVYPGMKQRLCQAFCVQKFGVKEPSVFIITPYNQQCAVLQDLHMLCEASRPELKSIQV